MQGFGGGGISPGRYTTGLDIGHSGATYGFANHVVWTTEKATWKFRDSEIGKMDDKHQQKKEDFFFSVSSWMAILPDVSVDLSPVIKIWFEAAGRVFFFWKL